MSDSVVRHAGQQVREASRQIIKDTGQQLAENLPGGRHIVGGMDTRSEQVVSGGESLPRGESFPQSSLREKKIEQQRKDEARIKTLRENLQVEIEKARKTRQLKEERRLEEFEEDRKKEEQRVLSGKKKSIISSTMERIRNRQGSREFGHRPTG